MPAGGKNATFCVDGGVLGAALVTSSAVVAQVAPNPEADRYVIEIRDAAGTSLLLTSADWTAKERHLAISPVLRLIGLKPRERGRSI
jgi:hypothetical protein